MHTGATMAGPNPVRSAARLAHGVLLAIAFCVFMPAGLLVARHKWIFAGRYGEVWHCISAPKS
jgi:hypothetical protein